VLFVRSNEISSSDRRNAFATGNEPISLAGGTGGSSMRDPQGPNASTLLEYIRNLNQLVANNPQATMIDTDAPGSSLAPSDSPTPMGLPGRLAALAGIDPDSPDRPAPPAGGLLALLLAAQR